MGKLNMKPFNLNEYLKNPSKKLVTGGGRKVRIICTDRKDADYPIVALISNNCGNGEDTLYYTKEGKFYTDSTGSLDLFFATEKQERWVNIYKNKEGYYPGRFFCSTKEEAVNLRCIEAECIATIKVEWEE